MQDSFTEQVIKQVEKKRKPYRETLLAISADLRQGIVEPAVTFIPAVEPLLPAEKHIEPLPWLYAQVGKFGKGNVCDPKNEGVN
jgi:hypothetical protein